MTNFPTSLDTLTNPSASDYLNSPSHSAQHSNANDILEALEAKVGITSSAVTTSHDYKLALITGTAKALPDSYLDTDGTLAANSDVKIATQKAVKTYVDDNTPDPTKLVDSNGVDVVITAATASAVNEITVTNAAVGRVPQVAATGDDTNIHLDLRGKGNGLVKISVLRQDDTTNTYIPSSVVLIGRKPITIPSGQKAQNAAVTFGITFSLAPIVIVASSTHSDVFASVAEEAVAGVNGTPGTSSFSLRMLTRSGNVAANRACQVDWIAIGTL